MICSISGRVALAFSPITSTFTGTWRQPIDGVAIGEDLALDDDAAAFLRRQGRCGAGTPCRRPAWRGRSSGRCRGRTRGRNHGGSAHGCRHRRRSCRRHRRRPGARLTSARRCRLLYDLPARLAVDRGDQPDATGIMLVGGIVETILLQVRGVACANDWSTARHRFVQLRSASSSSRVSNVGHLRPRFSNSGASSA